MTCPTCNSTATRVVDSRPTPRGVRRRRECERCGDRFTTHERVDAAATELEAAVVAYVRGLDPTTKEVPV